MCLVLFTLKFVFAEQSHSWGLWRDDIAPRRKTNAQRKIICCSLLLCSILALRHDIITTNLTWVKGKWWKQVFSFKYVALPSLGVFRSTHSYSRWLREQVIMSAIEKCRLRVCLWSLCSPKSTWCYEFQLLQIPAPIKSTVNKYKKWNPRTSPFSIECLCRSWISGEINSAILWISKFGT